MEERRSWEEDKPFTFKYHEGYYLPFSYVFSQAIKPTYTIFSV
jgi:hypothetical protein